ncbi:MAG TPA: nucleoside-diphosphate sugar epimerase/dehydratase [Hyphomicrobiaceae bacterium]|nr:nucleoside-diphosphate sugar epimerase/dehydratase [Hyphomicrobiaceae bacterium]
MTSNNFQERAAGLVASLVALPRWTKRGLLAASDALLLGLALWISFVFRFNTLDWPAVYWPDSPAFIALLLAAPVMGVATFHLMSLYRLVTRFFGAKGSARIAMAMLFAVTAWAALGAMLGPTGMPRTVILLYAILGTLFVILSRQVAAYVLKIETPVARGPGRPVLIYGAAGPGLALLDALNRSGTYDPVGLLDDQPSLWGQRIAGCKVYRPDKISRLIERHGVRDVLLALPAGRRRERQAVIRALGAYPVRVKTLPAAEDVASGRVAVSDLRPVDVEDLLGRDPVPADAELLTRDIERKSVLVTGAGGSIGSEITRQVLRLAPSRLVLLDASEAALYEIEMEVRRLNEGGRVTVAAVLGSVLDKATLDQTIAAHRVSTIYHAAAYKHVPIVEQNPFIGIANNTFGSLVVAEAAARGGVGKVVLVSTDKAVRPTNIMGASKRLAELIFQAFAARNRETVFTMVRFGNVLDSSGSVVRLFRKQIEGGGPVTVTDPKMIRYFMSIPEAATLVIQAGAMAKGGEVFVLDMGEPVKIDELARSMIRLMGLEVREPGSQDGDIAISYIGARPGEKLYEELLIGENTTTTHHPRIMRCDEPSLTARELEAVLEELRQAMRSGDLAEIRALLMRTVDYQPVVTAEARKAPPDLMTLEPPSKAIN